MQALTQPRVQALTHANMLIWCAQHTHYQLKGDLKKLEASLHSALTAWQSHMFTLFMCGRNK